MTTQKVKTKALDKQVKNNNLGNSGEPHRWKPGESGNPNGRPAKELCITSLVREILERDAGDGKTNAQLVAEAIVQLAKTPNARGHVPTVKELLDRIEGKVPETHKIEGDIPVSIIYKLKESEGKE